jgi:hypothetical protein
VKGRRAILAAALTACGCSRILGDPSGSLAELGDVAAVPASAVALPLRDGSLRFAVIGDTGTASRAQIELGRQMAAWQERVGFEFVLLTGDNIYGSDTAAEMKRKFEDPYAALLARNVKFHASLGNHDNPNQRFYKLYNMNGERYYSFRPKMGVRIFALDSNYIDRKQLAWLEAELSESGSEWKIVFFHHPLYSSGRNHGPALSTREVLEPVLVRHGVSVALTGHEHFYERIEPQKGILHFISGGGGKLRPGDIRPDPQTAKGFVSDLHFLIIEVDGDDLWFQAVCRAGKTVDSGSFRRPGAAPAAAAGS